jgi:hypothetical protein
MESITIFRDVFMERFFYSAFLCFLLSCTDGPKIKDGMTFGQTSAKAGKTMVVRFDRGKNFIQTKRMGLKLLRRMPQIAVWMEDTLHRYIGTVFVTKSFGAQQWKYSSPAPHACYEPMCAPYWLNQFIAAGNSAPTPAHPLPDAVTGATPTGGFSIKLVVPDSVKVFELYAEWNRSFDNNETFTQKKSGFNGQPSVVFCRRINMLDTGRVSDTLRLIGRGAESGKDGKLYQDTDKLTTTLKVFERVVVVRN